MRVVLYALVLAAALPDDDRPLKVQMVPQDTPGHWQAQLLGDLDRPVGEKIEFGGQTIPAKVTDKGALELDLRNDGKPRTIVGVLALVDREEGGRDTVQRTCRDHVVDERLARSSSGRRHRIVDRWQTREVAVPHSFRRDRKGLS